MVALHKSSVTGDFQNLHPPVVGQGRRHSPKHEYDPADIVCPGLGRENRVISEHRGRVGIREDL